MSERTITTDAVGKSKSAPEHAAVIVAVRGGGKSATGARTTVRDRAEAVREALDFAAIQRIETTELRVKDSRNVFEPECDAPYESTEELQVTCCPENVGEAVVEATDAGGTVQFIEFKVTDRRREELQNEALAMAMERARAKAEQMASVEDLTVTDVSDIRIVEVAKGMESIVDDALAESHDSDIQPTSVTVSERVEAEFSLS